MEATFPDVPPVNAALAVHLVPQSAGWSASKKPLPPLLRGRETLQYFDTVGYWDPFHWLLSALKDWKRRICSLAVIGHSPRERMRRGVTVRQKEEEKGGGTEHP